MQSIAAGSPHAQLGRKSPPGRGDGGSRVCVGVSASCPTHSGCALPRHTLATDFQELPQPLNPIRRGLSPVPSTTMLTYASSPLRPPKLQPGAWLPPPPHHPDVGPKDGLRVGTSILASPCSKSGQLHGPPRTCIAPGPPQTLQAGVLAVVR